MSRRFPRPPRGWDAHVLRSLERALAGESKIQPEVLAVHGFSTTAKRHFLNNACAFRGVNYLEIGTWKGATLLAAACGNEGTFTGVDNFSQFLEPREEFYENRRRLRGQCRVRFIEADCWTLRLGRLTPGVNVYFYDGAHNRQHQYDAFARYDPVFAPTFLAVVDDWRGRQVREGTRASFHDLGYRTSFERELCGARMRDPWWNGFFVAVVHKTWSALR